MTLPIPIIYCHLGRFPRYLRAALESARYFNPESKIYLITDVEGVKLDALGVEVCHADQLFGDKLKQFRKNYVHVSWTNATFARTCIERWFLVGELIRRNRFTRTIHLDSDALLFHDVRKSFAFIDSGPCMVVSKKDGPSVTYINRDIDPFIDLINSKYIDGITVERYQTRNREAENTGGMTNLDDMEFLKAFFEEQSKQITSYPNDLPIGHIDHGLFGPGDGMMSRPNRRHDASKRVYWDDDGRTFRPNFRRATDGSLVPALVIHFQNGAKRRICRFNRVGADSVLPRSLRLLYYKWLLN